MTDLTARLVDDPRPTSFGDIARLVVAAVTVVAVQAAVIDPLTGPVVRHLDLPLALAAVLVLGRPDQAVIIGLVFGLMVDAWSQRLFGIHLLAYAILGPVADRLPVPAWRRAGPLLAWRAGVMGLTATAVVAVGRAVAAGRLLPGLASAVLVTGIVTGLVAVAMRQMVGRRSDPIELRRRHGRWRWRMGRPPGRFAGRAAVSLRRLGP